MRSAGGGFITGRLRTKWVGVHTHEVCFRDTAHGLLTWCVAVLVTTLLVASAASSVIGGGGRAAAAVGGGAAQAAGPAVSQATSMSGYDLDSLFRADRPDPAGSSQTAAAQAGRIIANGVSSGDVPPADRSYLANLVAARAGISQADAETRVDDVITREKGAELKARQAADAARKVASEVAIFTALSMVIGAFIACAAAAFGGSVRDDY